PLGALEPDILRARVGPDAAQEFGQAGASPRTDRTPTFDADVAGGMLLLRQRVEIRPSPGPLVVAHAAPPQAVPPPPAPRRLVSVIIGIERKRSRDRAFRIGRGQPRRTEQPRLDAIVEARNNAQGALGGRPIDDIAAREEGQRTETRASAQEMSPRGVGQEL